ncbi:MAG: hypothetical protein NBV65_03335 [Burkholderiaceae bacterium]|nr:hypothetical protein [Burkholderiaceae bacterium]
MSQPQTVPLQGQVMLVTGGDGGARDHDPADAGDIVAVTRSGAQGFLLIVVSNQPGIARGLIPEAAVASVRRRIDVLAVCVDAAGDVLMCTPELRALREGGLPLVLAAGPSEVAPKSVVDAVQELLQGM